MEVLGTYPSVGACFSEPDYVFACTPSYSARFIPDTLDPYPDNTHSHSTAALGTRHPNP